MLRRTRPTSASSTTSEAFVRDLAGPGGLKAFSATPRCAVFMTSPRLERPIISTRRSTVLVQIKGSKDLWVCDPLDRSITTGEPRSALLRRRHHRRHLQAARPPARPRGSSRFGPGGVVHIPTHGAHWVQNHDEVSISLQSQSWSCPAGCMRTSIAPTTYLRRLGLSRAALARTLGASPTAPRRRSTASGAPSGWSGE